VSAAVKASSYTAKPCMLSGEIVVPGRVVGRTLAAPIFRKVLGKLQPALSRGILVRVFPPVRRSIANDIVTGDD
jgi:hypothetical protein